MEVLWEDNPRWHWVVVLLIVLVLLALMRFVEALKSKSQIGLISS
jgi:hypothetical protein